MGFVCPCESPEGANVGLQTNMSLLTKISNESSDLIINILENEDIIVLDDINPGHVDYTTKIIVNGKWLVLIKTIRIK